MGSPDTSLPEQDESEFIAAPWHTAAVVLLLLGIAVLSAWRASEAVPATGNARIVSYGMVLVWEWLTVAFIAWGVRRRDHPLASLIGGSWATGRAILRDVGIAVLFLIGSSMILGLLQFALRNRPTLAVRNLLPQTALETVVWILLAATAGFCEEIIFRGYLQQQLGRIAHNPIAGLFLQAVAFGVCHGYQGTKSMFVLAVYGGLFGLLARQRRSLRPGMIAHSLQDGVGGLVLREVLKKLPAG